MPTIQIADKPTLDSVKTTVEAIGGIKYNSTTSKPQIYDTVNSTWVDLEVGGGGASPTLIVTNPNHVLDNTNVTVISENRLFTSTINMGVNEYITFELPWLGKYIVNGEISQFVDIENYGGVLLEAAVSYSSFSSCTDDELSSMLQLHYNDFIDLSDIWSVGDTRTISLSSMPAPVNSPVDTWDGQDITVVIIGFDHTDLATPINGHTKAAITVQTREVLSSSSNTTGLIYCHKNAYLYSSEAKWSSLNMRTYLNFTVWDALSSTFKAAIKPSTHYRHTKYDTTDAEQVTDNLFLPSYPEIYGTASYSSYAATSPVEGTQFEYYQTSANRIKYPNKQGTAGSSAASWWTGSVSSYYSSSNSCYWCAVNNVDGSANINHGKVANGLAPAWAM